MKSAMSPPEQRYTPMMELVAVADNVGDNEMDKEMDSRSTNANAAKWTIIPPKHAERESTVNTTQNTEIQTASGMMNELATTAVSQDTSSPNASTSTMPGINPTKSTKAQHPHGLVQQEIATLSD
jgi:hypothetical protein